MLPINAFTHWMRIAIGSFASRIAAGSKYARATSSSAENAAGKKTAASTAGQPTPESTVSLEVLAVMTVGTALILGMAYGISPKFRPWERKGQKE